MSRGLVGAMLGLGIAALVNCSADDAAAQAKKPAGWLNSYAAARTAARQAGKPIFLVFR